MGMMRGWIAGLMMGVDGLKGWIDGLFAMDALTLVLIGLAVVLGINVLVLVVALVRARRYVPRESHLSDVLDALELKGMPASADEIARLMHVERCVADEAIGQLADMGIIGMVPVRGIGGRFEGKGWAIV